MSAGTARAAALAAALALAAPGRGARAEDRPLPPPPPGPRADFRAERADFDAASSSLRLSGGVLLQESTWTVKAQELWIDAKGRKGRSEGPLLVEDGWSAVYGESGEFDFGAHAGTLRDTSAGHGDWRIQARQASVDASRRLEYRGASFSSCSAPEPHYHFTAGRVRVSPRRHLIARNVVFYLGEVPVFYTPVLYKSLKKRHFLRWKSQPGYDNRNGPFLRNTLTTEHSPRLYSKLYADGYLKQGLGAGGELHRRDGEDSRGALYGYRIRETSTGDGRWTVLGQQYQALGSSTSLQGRLQLQSDADFNNHYARSSAFRVSPELVNGAAVVHRFSRATARLSYSRLDAAASDRRSFLLQKESAPRLELQTVPLRLGRLPWLNVLDASADSRYQRGRPYLEKSLEAGWEGAGSLRLARGASLAPKAFYRQSYLNRFERATVASSTDAVLDALVGRYGAEAALRLGTPLGGLDLTYRHLRRQRPGGFADDASALDRGVEESVARVSDVLLLGPAAWARLSAGYDFRVFRGRTVGFRRRVEPFVAEAGWSAGEDWSFFLREDYQLDEGQRALLADARWGEREGGAFAGGGLAYNAAEPGRYAASLEAGVAPSSATWRLSAGLRALADSRGGLGRLRGPRVFEKELACAKTWHDFHGRLAARVRPGGVGEISARLDLRFGTADPKAAPRRDWEAELWPGRSPGGEFAP